VPVIDQAWFTSLRMTPVGPAATSLPLLSITTPLALPVLLKSKVQPVTIARAPCTVTESSLPIGDSDTRKAAQPSLLSLLPGPRLRACRQTVLLPAGTRTCRT
jgi:hypothetical protein